LVAYPAALSSLNALETAAIRHFSTGWLVFDTAADVYQNRRRGLGCDGLWNGMSAGSCRQRLVPCAWVAGGTARITGPLHRGL
jgi:hypothetical protein